MYLVRLAYRNFFRNTRRSIISCTSVAIAIAFILVFRSYMRGVLDNVSDNVVNLICGHIRITTQEYERQERLLPLSEAVELSPGFRDALQNEEVVLASPRIKFGVMLGQEELTVPALAYAIHPENERDISGLHRRMVKGEYIESSERAAILGSGLAKRLNVGIGDTLTVITRTAYDSPAGINLRIAGIFSTGIGGVDRSVFYVPLDVGQVLLDLEGRATEVILMLRTRERAVEVAQALRANLGLSIVPFQHNPLLQYLAAVQVISWILYLIVMLVACSTIANTMIMVLYERAREIGMMKAMGLSNPSIMGLLVVEAGMIGVLGSLAGATFGSVLSYWLKYRGIDLTTLTSASSMDMPFGPVIYLSPTVLVVAGVFMFGLLATVIVVLLPIRNVARLEPAKALKTI